MSKFINSNRSWEMYFESEVNHPTVTTIVIASLCYYLLPLLFGPTWIFVPLVIFSLIGLYEAIQGESYTKRFAITLSLFGLICLIDPSVTILNLSGLTLILILCAPSIDILSEQDLVDDESPSYIILQNVKEWGIWCPRMFRNFLQNLRRHSDLHEEFFRAPFIKSPISNDCPFFMPNYAVQLMVQQGVLKQTQTLVMYALITKNEDLFHYATNEMSPEVPNDFEQCGNRQRITYDVYHNYLDLNLLENETLYTYLCDIKFAGLSHFYYIALLQNNTKWITKLRDQGISLLPYHHYQDPIQDIDSPKRLNHAMYNALRESDSQMVQQLLNRANDVGLKYPRYLSGPDIPMPVSVWFTRFILSNEFDNQKVGCPFDEDFRAKILTDKNMLQVIGDYLDLPNAFINQYQIDHQNRAINSRLLGYPYLYKSVMANMPSLYRTYPEFAKGYLDLVDDYLKGYTSGSQYIHNIIPILKDPQILEILKLEDKRFIIQDILKALSEKDNDIDLEELASYRGERRSDIYNRYLCLIIQKCQVTFEELVKTTDSSLDELDQLLTTEDKQLIATSGLSYLFYGHEITTPVKRSLKFILYNADYTKPLKVFRPQNPGSTTYTYTLRSYEREIVKKTLMEVYTMQELPTVNFYSLFSHNVALYGLMPRPYVPSEIHENYIRLFYPYNQAEMERRDVSPEGNSEIGNRIAPELEQLSSICNLPRLKDINRVATNDARSIKEDLIRQSEAMLTRYFQKTLMLPNSIFLTTPHIIDYIKSVYSQMEEQNRAMLVKEFKSELRREFFSRKYYVHNGLTDQTISQSLIPTLVEFMAFDENIIYNMPLVLREGITNLVRICDAYEKSTEHEKRSEESTIRVQREKLSDQYEYTKGSNYLTIVSFLNVSDLTRLSNTLPFTPESSN